MGTVEDTDLILPVIQNTQTDISGNMVNDQTYIVVILHFRTKIANKVLQHDQLATQLCYLPL